MAQSINHKRKEAMFLRALSEIISEEVSNSNVSYPTVTAVKLAPDAGHVRIYLTFESNPEKSLEALKGASGFIRSRLSKLNIRKTPTLDFKIDDTMIKARRIDEILENIKKNKKD